MLDAFLIFLFSRDMRAQVPQFRPQAALHMVDKLIKNEMLSPLLISNETLATIDDKAFRRFMENWTESAMVPPYVGAMP